MKILLLHGWHSVVGGKKPTFLKEHGHEVINPAFSDDHFEEAVRIAHGNYNEHQPDVIVGSSPGGAVAVNMNSKGTPLVLLCPAWKNWDSAHDRQTEYDHPALTCRRRDPVCRLRGVDQQQQPATGERHPSLRLWPVLLDRDYITKSCP
jgi:hypothetical protein